MMLHPRTLVRAAIAFIVLAPALIRAGDQTKLVKKPFHIGISDALIRGQTTPAAAMIQVQPLAEVFSMVGGCRPQFQFDSPEGLAKSLHEGKIQLAVMPGIELGWLGEKAQGLAPVALAYTNDIKLKAYVLTRRDTKLDNIASLKGNKVAMPRRSQHHTQVFLHQTIANAGCQPQGFFAFSPTPPDTDAAIECVLEKEIPAVVIDGQSWEVYQERKPGRARRLKVIAESPSFPTAALVVKPGKIDQADFDNLRNGLLTAHTKPFCRQIMNFWRISQFVAPTPEYEALVKSIVKDIPQPITPATFMESK